MSEVLAQREDVALAQYGDRGQVRELGSRIKHFLPNGNKMSDSDAHSLAQLALAHGLDPFIGDCWWIPGKGIMVGINGLRKAARRASPYSVDIQMMRTNERAEYDVPDGAAAYIARLFRGDIMAQMAAARQPIFPFIGAGVCTKGERIPHTKSAAWVARKRAEADALKAAYDIAFATEPTIESQGVTINGALVGDGAPQIVGQHERSEAEMQQISNSLYGDDDAPGLGDEWDQGIADANTEDAPEVAIGKPESEPEAKPDNGKDADDAPPASSSSEPPSPAHKFRTELIAAAESYAKGYAHGVNADKATATASPAQAGLIASLFTEAFAPDDNAAKEYHSALKFLFGIDSAKGLTFCQARSVLHWLTTKKDPATGEYPLNEGVTEKARLCLREAMLDAGQTELDMAGEEE